MTTALAVQLVVTLREMPSEELQAQLEAALARLDGLEQMADPYAQVKSVEQEILTLLVKNGLVEGQGTTAATATASPAPNRSPSGSPPTTSASSASDSSPGASTKTNSSTPTPTPAPVAPAAEGNTTTSTTVTQPAATTESPPS